MNIDADALKLLTGLSTSTIYNYIVPEMTSHLITRKEDGSCMRLFVMGSEQLEPIQPHSHRFDFHCLVLRGKVENTIYCPSSLGWLYRKALLTYQGKPGDYAVELGTTDPYSKWTSTYNVGDWYKMSADEIHDIWFSPDAVVLFLEGPQVSNTSVMLCDPDCEDPTQAVRTEPWMFKKEL